MERKLIQLHTALSIGSLKEIKATSPPLLCCKYKGVWPLTRAAEFGHLHIIKWLVENGSYLHIWDNDEETPIGIAVKKGHLHVVQWFLAQSRQYPLEFLSLCALHAEQWKVFQFLVKQEDFRINYLLDDQDFKTILGAAVYYDAPFEIIKDLVKKEAKLNHLILMFAIQRGNYKAVCLFLKLDRTMILKVDSHFENAVAQVNAKTPNSIFILCVLIEQKCLCTLNLCCIFQRQLRTKQMVKASKEIEGALAKRFKNRLTPLLDFPMDLAQLIESYTHPTYHEWINMRDIPGVD